MPQSYVEQGSHCTSLLYLQTHGHIFFSPPLWTEKIQAGVPHLIWVYLKAEIKLYVESEKLQKYMKGRQGSPQH